MSRLVVAVLVGFILFVPSSAFAERIAVTDDVLDQISAGGGAPTMPLWAIKTFGPFGPSGQLGPIAPAQSRHTLPPGQEKCQGDSRRLRGNPYPNG